MPINVNIKMKVDFCCKFCGTAVLSKISRSHSIGNPFTRSKNGQLKFMSEAILKDIDCPSCGFAVIKLDGLGRGIYGTTNMSSVR